MGTGSRDDAVGITTGLGSEFLDRGAWGAEPAVDWPIELAPIRGVMIHHTNTENNDPDPLSTVRRIQHFHSRTRGWGDIGYSFLILEDGRILEGREGSATAPAPLGVIAGHAFGHNVGTVGIAVVGRFHRRSPTAAAWTSLVELVTFISRACAIDPNGSSVTLATGHVLPTAICAHLDVAPTTCPGAALTELLTELRRQAAVRLALPRLGFRTPCAPDGRSVTHRPEPQRGGNPS